MRRKDITRLETDYRTACDKRHKARSVGDSEAFKRADRAAQQAYAVMVEAKRLAGELAS